MELIVIVIPILVFSILYLIGAVNLKKDPSAKRRATVPVGAGYPYPVPNDAPSGGYAVLGFFIPIVGLILYIMWKDQTPLRARSAGKGALISVIVNVALTIISVIVIVVLSQAGSGY